MTKEMIDQIKQKIISYADHYKIERKFLIALVKTESNFNPLAQRYEIGYPYIYSVKELAETVGCSRSTMEHAQKCSYGICQVMGAVAYEAGYRGWPAGLFNVETNLKYACDHIQMLNKKFDLLQADEAYAAYNAGAPRKVDREWINKTNVKNFMKNYEGLSKVC